MCEMYLAGETIGSMFDVPLPHEGFALGVCEGAGRLGQE